MERNEMDEERAEREGSVPAWRQLTAARIGLARAGASVGTAPLLAFRLAHAAARDAVHAALDEDALVGALPPFPAGPLLAADSLAPDRRTYLMRPDLGRRLDAAGTARLGARAGTYDLAVVLGAGLSALALQRHAAPLLSRLLPALGGWRLAPPVLVRGARVAVGDAAAAALGAAAVLVLIGERPGLSAPDSLGAYLTWAPTPGTTTDAERNCVSNVRPEGLDYEEAAHRLFHLLERMRALRLSGVGLKDESGDAPLLAAGSPPTG